MRKFSQVDAHIPLSAKLMPEEFMDDAVSRIIEDPVVGAFNEPPRMLDEALAEWLEMLNSKMDAILKLMTLSKEGFSSLPLRHVKISGSGLVFGVNERYNVGDTLEIKMILPGSRHLAMYVYGKVMAITEEGGKLRAAVEFVSLEEQMRDSIVEYVFERERELIREKMEEGQD